MTSPLSDEDLVTRTLAGEEDAFCQLYDRYRHQVFSTAYRILQDREEALDTTQEIFVKLHRSLVHWNVRKARFSTWLYRLATNHAIDSWRHIRRRAESPLEEQTGEKEPRRYRLRDAIHSPYSRLQAKESVDEVRRCVDDLPELQKKVFVLRYFQELKLEEIAKMENCSLGTVKTSLFRGTRAVRRCMRRLRGAG